MTDSGDSALTDPSSREPDAGELLTDLRSLRERVRLDRHGFAFPLFLFGGLILLAPLLYGPAPRLADPNGGRVVVLAKPGPFPQFEPAVDIADGWLVGWYWMLVIVGGLAATGWWYRHRARRHGVETSVAVPFAAAGAALFGLLIGDRLLTDVLTPEGSLYSDPATNLPVLFGSAALAALALAWALRPGRTERARSRGVAAGTLLAMIAFSALCVYMHGGFAALLVIAVALLVLAAYERSTLLGVVAVVFTAVSVPANHSLWYWNFPELFRNVGLTWFPDTRIHALYTLLVPGLVLLVGGAVAALRGRGARG
ncbi:hypothetical protein [Actinophytocola xanthii]|uniref:Uncharacterized protein n=1 Tax=Actinophytocola xanthii TaxID=1912961 RepID=A0A1Q8CX36_9PSEU|nr:hypothetical protein [Actinophytocola xanthii]OLF18902.1 hypothetical protein BU204_03305 [Actinophytocola xanthii]